MDIISKAKELGNLIGSSEEMTSYKRWEENLARDHKARVILKEYQEVQSEMVMAVHGNSEKDILDGLKQKLLEKYDEVNECDIARNYIEAKEKLDILIKKVNDVLVYSITGEQSCSSHSCSSCGGGCSK
ncbi:YlbF family regulator [Acetivibrio cellulolyticus]|uniref:YlbF family regulator n=1 Tax=Acetivibrio cellulolyticus TaxID=35830 RepID=UPI0001E2D950|nr:YlbF family regulator [Acetivibrio cellulolyticus]